MYKQGDILLTLIPYSDSAVNRQRPVLVLSNDEYNQRSEELIVAPITSRLRNLQYAILIRTDDLSEGELSDTSAIKVNKVYTLSQKIVKKKFGHISKESLDKIFLQLKELL